MQFLRSCYLQHPHSHNIMETGHFRTILSTPFPSPLLPSISLCHRILLDSTLISVHYIQTILRPLPFNQRMRFSCVYLSSLLPTAMVVKGPPVAHLGLTFCFTVSSAPPPLHLPQGYTCVGVSNQNVQSTFLFHVFTTVSKRIARTSLLNHKL